MLIKLVIDFVMTVLMLMEMYSSFTGNMAHESVVKLFADYLSIIGIYICGTYYVLKIDRKRKKTKDIKEHN